MSSTPEFDLSSFAEHTQRMQESMARTRERIEQLQATGSDGSGVITATVGGDGRVLALKIDPSVIAPTRPDTLADLVVEAVNTAIDALRELHAESITTVTEQIGGLLDGLDEGPLGRPDTGSARPGDRWSV